MKKVKYLGGGWVGISYCYSLPIGTICDLLEVDRDGDYWVYPVNSETRICLSSKYFEDVNQVHPEVAKVLKDLGLHAEPYDAGTWMAYEG